MSRVRPPHAPTPDPPEPGAPARVACAGAAWALAAAVMLVATGAALASGCTPGENGAAPAAVDAAASPEAAVVARWHLHGEPMAPPLERPDFVLRDAAGEPFDFRARTAGQLTLLFFGYTSCPDVCPVHLANLAAALRKLDPELRSRVRVVFVGVDPDRDTPEQVGRFVARFDPAFVGLAGTPEELASAQRAAGVPPAFVDSRWEDGYSVSHAGWVLVITPDDRARLRYPFGTRQWQWAHDLEVLARHGWPADAALAASEGPTGERALR